MIELKQITSGYEAGHQDRILQDISVVFRDGELTVIIGPNGSGKSTLLRSVMGFLPIESGSVTHDGRDLSELTERDIARRTAFLPQSRPVPQIRVREMVLHGRFPYLSFPRQYSSKDRQIVSEALRRADAADLERHSMSELSGGQRQKVYIAMALAQETQNILFDEPTTYLDIRHQYETMQMCRKIVEEGRCAVAVLHDLSMAFQFADRLIVLQNGRIRMQGTPEDVFAAGIIKEVFGVELLKLTAAEGQQIFVTRPAEAGKESSI